MTRIVQPISILSAVLAAGMEVGLLSLLLFFLQAAPLEVEPPEVITVDFSFLQQTQETPPEAPPAPQVPLVARQPEPEPDPLFEELAAFVPQTAEPARQPLQSLQTVSPNVQPDTPVPTSLFSDAIPSLVPVAPTLPAKKRVNVASPEILELGSLEQLRDFQFPNYDDVRNRLQNDYDRLLKTSAPGSLVSGTVLVEMVWNPSGKVDVQTLSSPSPKLSNIVVSNLMLLRGEQRLDAIIFRVKVVFTEKVF